MKTNLHWPASMVVTLFVLALSCETFAVNDRVVITLDPPTSAKEPQKFRVRGLPVKPGQFSVHLVQNGKVSATELLGELAERDDGWEFTPRFSLQSGMTYRVVLRLEKEKHLTQDFVIPKPPAAARTKLVAIFPTRDVVPENLLKFYLHFSAPMSRGEVYRRVRLVDEKDRVVEQPFLELAEELWSPDGMRLTLYFDPGRIKRGLKPRELFGPALIEGQSYTLVVDAAWPDAEGEPLAASVRKSMRVVAPDDVQPTMKNWRIAPPAAGSRAPLVVRFDESLDAAMLDRVLAVHDAQGRQVAGRIRVEQHEAVWSFEPARPWEAGTYSLVVATALEDLAGNSLGRPFEVDVFRPANPGADAATVSVPFTVATR